MAWGLLRFSPGSYPNEYGILSSFSLLLLLILHMNRPRFIHFIFMGFTFIAFLLATTRAAYLSFLFSLIYLWFSSPKIRKPLLQIFSLCLSLLFLLQLFYVDFFSIFAKGIKAISLTEGSTGMRFQDWAKGFYDLNRALFFGTGFGSQINAHNVYLEILFELGLIGSLLLLMTLISSFAEKGRELKALILRRAEHPELMVGLIHVLFFAASNHNMHHFVTWFVILLLVRALFSEEKASQALSYGR